MSIIIINPPKKGKSIMSDVTTVVLEHGSLILPTQALIECSQQGDMQANCEYWEPRIDWNKQEMTDDDIKRELFDQGAWDEDTLCELEANRRRILWIAANQWREEWKGIEEPDEDEEEDDDMDDGERLLEIKEEIINLIDEAYNLVPEGLEKDRARGYWLAQIRMGLDGDHGYLGKCMVTMQDTIDRMLGYNDSEEG